MPAIPTTEKLAQAMEQVGCPAWMISRARDGFYDDFKSDLAAPIVTLVADLRGQGFEDLAQRAINGEFDGTKEEGDEWMAREGGYLLMHDLGMLRQQRRPKPQGFGEESE